MNIETFRVGTRVYVPGDDMDWPLGRGRIVGWNGPNSWAAVELNVPAKRHESDGARKSWYVKASALELDTSPLTSYDKWLERHPIKEQPHKFREDVLDYLQGDDK